MRILIGMCAFVLATTVGLAQESDDKPATEESLTGFQWLKQFEGNWETAFDGTVQCQAAGKTWIVNQYRFSGELAGVQSIAYDDKQERFVGTWIDSSSTFIWRYSGSLDESGKALILEAEGPDFSDASKMRQYRDIYEFVSADEIAAKSQMLDDSGEWKTFNTSKMTRRKE